MEKKLILDVHEKPKPLAWITLSAQHVLAMFGATVLVPMLTGLPVSLALISSGIGTLFYLLVTKGKAPVYLGSSFAFISPIIAAMALGGQGAVTGGLVMAGIFYTVVAVIIRFLGTDWINKLLPPIVVGPTIMVIGLYLAPIAINMANEHIAVALITLGAAIAVASFTKGLFQLLPVFFGIVAGYAAALVFGIVDYSHLSEVSLFVRPDFAIFKAVPVFNMDVAALFLPVAIVTITEHIGDVLLLNDIIGRDLTKKPGLHRTLIGDGVATLLAGLIGGPANTTYGENIGVIGLTKVASVWVIGGAAAAAVVLGFFGPFTALIQTIPTAVMGGVSILLFGIIATCGARVLINERVDVSSQRNLIIGSVILVIGVGNMGINLGPIELSGMAFAAIVGIILNQVLPDKK